SCSHVPPVDNNEDKSTVWANPPICRNCSVPVPVTFSGGHFRFTRRPRADTRLPTVTQPAKVGGPAHGPPARQYGGVHRTTLRCLRRPVLAGPGVHPVEVNGQDAVAGRRPCVRVPWHGRGGRGHGPELVGRQCLY